MNETAVANLRPSPSASASSDFAEGVERGKGCAVFVEKRLRAAVVDVPAADRDGLGVPPDEPEAAMVWRRTDRIAQISDEVLLSLARLRPGHRRLVRVPIHRPPRVTRLGDEDVLADRVGDIG